MANASIINSYRQLPKAATIQESLVDDSSSPPKMVGVPVYENSSMDGTLGAGADYVLLIGDFNQVRHRRSQAWLAECATEHTFEHR